MDFFHRRIRKRPVPQRLGCRVKYPQHERRAQVGRRFDSGQAHQPSRTRADAEAWVRPGISLVSASLAPGDNRFVYLLKNTGTLPHFYVGVTADVDARDSIFERGDRIEERRSLTSGSEWS